MKSKLSDELTLLTTKLMMCANKREIINLSGEFGKLIEKVIEQEAEVHTPEEKSITATIKFTKEEVADMAKTFKKEFIANGLAARVIKRQSGKNTFLYEIRYRRNGYKIEVSSTNLNEAKRKFVEETKPENILNHRVKTVSKNACLLQEVAIEWLQMKQDEIDPRTFRDYKMNCEKRIYPVLGTKIISTVKTVDIKKVINSAQGRVIETLQTIFKGIMHYAEANGFIYYNPMKAIQFKKVKRKNRRALTKDEQRKFLERIELPEYAKYRQALLLEYFFGLRPWELTDARFSGDFLIALNAKHEDDGECVYKKIPIPKQAKELLDITAPITLTFSLDTLNRKFKKLMEDEKVTQYYLRHTFSTICQQYVRPDIVDIWMGDSSERLVGRVYTHFPDEFMIEQMKNVRFYE